MGETEATADSPHTSVLATLPAPPFVVFINCFANTCFTNYRHAFLRRVNPISSHFYNIFLKQCVHVLISVILF